MSKKKRHGQGSNQAPRAATEQEALLDIARVLYAAKGQARKSDAADLPRAYTEDRDEEVKFMAARNPVQRRQSADEDEPIFGIAYQQGTLIPPVWPANILWSLYEESDTLGACCRSYVDNIERDYDYEYVGPEGLIGDKQSKAEKKKLEDFFSQVNEKQSYKTVARKKRLDQVVTGNGYREVLDDQETLEPLLMYHVPGTWMRITDLDKESVLTWVDLPRNGEIKKSPVYRRFRRFCRYMPSKEMQWFKEFGDPRMVNKKTGEYYKNPDGTFIFETDIKEKKLDQKLFVDKATSIWWSRDTFGGNAYGTPIWVGAMSAIRGAYLANWVNYDTLDHGGMPPWLLMIYGKLAPGTRKYLDDLVKTWRNPKVYSEPGYIEIEPNLMSFNTSAGAKTGAEFVSMRDMRSEESMFPGYRKECRETVGMVFRLHPILYGITEGPGGTNYAALETVQNQVWGPIQEAEDERTNVELIQGRFKIFRWKIKTRPAPIGDQEQQYKAVGMASRAQGPTAKDLVDMENRILGTSFSVPDHPFYNQLSAAESLALVRQGQVIYDEKTWMPVKVVPPKSQGGEGGQNQPSPGGVVPASKSDEVDIEAQVKRLGPLASAINLLAAMQRVEREVEKYEPETITGKEEIRQ